MDGWGGISHQAVCRLVGQHDDPCLWCSSGRFLVNFRERRRVCFIPRADHGEDKSAVTPPLLSASSCDLRQARN